MGYPNSTNEIDASMITTGIEELLNSDDIVAKEEHKFKLELARKQRKADRLAAMGYGYYLDNCGDEVDGDPAYYCRRCIQPECGKRLAKITNYDNK